METQRLFFKGLVNNNNFLSNFANNKIIKKMNKIKLIIVIAFLTIRGICYSQQAQQSQAKYNSNTDKILNTSSYIFEGKEIKDEPFIDSKIGRTHNARKVLVTAIYKNADGKLKLGTLEIIDDMTSYQIDRRSGTILQVPWSDYTPPEVNGVYFCNNYGSSPHVIINDNDNLVLKQISGVGFYFENTYKKDTTAMIFDFYGFRAFGKNYISKEDFYLDISKFPNINIPDSLTQKKKSK